ncbi:5-methyltetrahydropteroyltriglutamate--homocysteine S-methyltransferase [Terrilactibacillus laevilacticus]|uniref:5-methyltetrahydropteroyltriglutamate--homocysteine S-methyltransferase n=1 Tax=Terrilactibacillus laevilacticus TaxID=1380157 RepID=A0ABW5PNI0_9BACI|nr:5-methyltetrahydropteroyltriglutamate--homocysteine S-methyltransferase [Terrilactibacillus laevilacticus]
MNQSIKRNFPPFRADQVGSLLRTDRIKQARQQKAQGEITSAQLRLIEDEEIKRIVAKQKEIGLQAVTDGEFRRAWWHFDFLEGLDGVQKFVSDSGIQFHNVTTKARGIKVVDKIDFTNHPMLEDYKFLHRIAGDHVAKMTIPSPNMLLFRGIVEDGVYPYKEDMYRDLSHAYKKAIKSFYDAGCRYLQLDDTAWAHLCSDEQKEKLRSRGFDPEEMRATFTKTINDAVAGRPEDMAITMHICRGNFQSTWLFAGGYEPIAEDIFEKLNVDGLFLEYDNDRSGGFEPLRFVNRSDLNIVLGLITSKYGELENADDVKRRIEEASKYVNLDQLCLSPQCGFASTEEGNKLTEEQQWDKLRHVVNIANDVWK